MVIYCPATVEQGEPHHSHRRRNHESETSDCHVDPEGIQQDAEENDDEPGYRLGSLHRSLYPAEACPIRQDIPPMFVPRTVLGQESCVTPARGCYFP